jgi:iron complex outermembrane receptor protein
MLAVNSQAAADRKQRTRVPPRSDRGLTAHRPALLALAVAAALMSIVVLPAQAQAQTPAAAGAIYELPAQPLDHALAQLARQAGLQLLANNELVQGRQAPALLPTRDLQAAIDALLRGSGLRGRVEGATLLVERMPVPSAAGETVLPAVRVSATQTPETASGPVSGYVARRSATGTKTDTPIIETPQTISVVGAEQMRATGAQTLQQALVYTSGIATGTSGENTAIADSFYLRGFQADNQFGSFYRDGMRHMANIYNGKQEPYALERIEVLKGPSSILYGAAAPGGVINTVTKRPQLTAAREVNLELSSFNRRQLSADFTGPLSADGQWTYRLTALARDSETFVDFGRDDRLFVAPALTWRPSADTSVTLLASYQESKQSDPGNLPVQGTLQPNPNGVIPRHRFLGEPEHSRFDTTVRTAAYLVEHAFSNQIKLSHKLRQFESDLDYEYGLLGAFDGRTLARQSRRHTDDTSIFTTDTSLQFDFATGAAKHTLLAGVDHVRSDYATHRLRGTFAPIDVFNPVYGGAYTIGPFRDIEDNRRQTGVYLQDQIKFNGKWVLLVGGRHDRFDLEDVFNGDVGGGKDKATTGRAGLVYLADNGLAPYAGFSQSFNPQGVDAAGTPFEPDRGRQLEAGVRYQPANADLMLSASVFQLTRSNVLTADPQNPGFSIANGEVRARGFEFEGKGRVTRSLNIIGAYTYTDVRVTSDDSRLSGIPYHTASLLADFNFGAWDLPNLVVGAGVRRVSSKPGSAAEASFGVPGFTIIDARLAYDLASWRYALNLFNATDKRYIPSTCFSGVSGCDYGEPRRLSASVSYVW